MTLRLLAGSSAREPETSTRPSAVYAVAEKVTDSEALSPLACAFIGAFVFDAERTVERLDFDSVELRADGSYDAKVDAHLVNPSARSYGARVCTLPETGTWNAYKVSGQTRIRMRPTTGPARVYSVSMEGSALVLARRSQRTLLLAELCEVPADETPQPGLAADVDDRERRTA